MLEIVGVVSLRGAPAAVSTCATAQFRRFFECGRALIKCLLLLGSGWFMNLVVLYEYQSADTCALQFAFTEQLFDAALGKLGAVARGRPCLNVGDLRMEHCGEIAGNICVRLFPRFEFFLFSRISLARFWELVLWHLCGLVELDAWTWPLACCG